RARSRDADRRRSLGNGIVEVPIGKKCLASQSPRRRATGQFNGVRGGNLGREHREIVDQTVHSVTARKAVRQQGQFDEVRLQGIGAAVVEKQFTVDVNVFLVQFLREDKVV